ncbi:MBL fold metallo-hydrolase [Streptomyces sp. NPDC046805]|uniref:MBL fold metallo-hydrolase n=1 Tax=Streptomyces sp. NPDC046805 TaxID=3155134 RepID=UPI0033E8E04B
MSATLIYGERDAILIDAPHLEEQSRQVAEWVLASGKNLVAMYATHGHGDHWFGFSEVAKHFPDARMIATEGTVALAEFTAGQRMAFWNSQFPGQIVKDIVLPEVIDDYTFLLEGEEVRFVEAGDSDGPDTTFVHVPSIGLVVAGDIVYNGVHPYLAGGERARPLPERRADWIAAIDKIAAVHPRAASPAWRRALRHHPWRRVLVLAEFQRVALAGQPWWLSPPLKRYGARSHQSRSARATYRPNVR